MSDGVQPGRIGRLLASVSNRLRGHVAAARDGRLAIEGPAQR
jgi:hypothetical protein